MFLNTKWLVIAIIRDVVRKKNGIMWEKFPKAGGRSDRISSFYQNLPIPNLPCKWEKFVLVLVHIVLLVLVFALLVNT